jgi:hypothetical protein
MLQIYIAHKKVIITSDDIAEYMWKYKFLEGCGEHRFRILKKINFMFHRMEHRKAIKFLLRDIFEECESRAINWRALIMVRH